MYKKFVIFPISLLLLLVKIISSVLSRQQKDLLSKY